MKVTPQEAITHIKDTLTAGLVPMLSGDPGGGKSDIMRQVCNYFNLFLLDIRLSQLDPTELNGFPAIKENRATHIPMDVFPLEDDPIPENKAGWMIFFDEVNSCSLATQAASYKIMLDRMIGMKKLHKRAVIACAGNLATNNAIVNRMSTAMQSRLVHLELQIDVDQWVQWANQKGLDHRTIAYIQQAPNDLHNFNPDHNDKTFACPRTWEFTSKLIKKTPGSLQPKLPLLTGTIGEAAAQQFVLYTEIYTSIPSIDEILTNPTTIPVSQEPGILFAIANVIAAWAKENTIDKLMLFIERLPLEFATITVQNLIQRNQKMGTNKSILKWMKQNAFHAF